MEISNKGFGAYDIRGIYPDTVNEELAYRIGRVFPSLFDAKKVAVGHDIRLSGPSLTEALERGLTEAGCDVIDIGQCGTEMIYFTTAHLGLDGGIMITASHNPKEYNGMKFVRKESRPISSDTGLKDIEREVMKGAPEPVAKATGKVEHKDILQEYVEHILSYVDVSKLKPFKVVANTGNGAAGPIINELAKHLPFDIIKVYNEPDGNFPNGVPNPILQENREATAKVVREQHADVGVAWDGDFDRCFLFDEKGGFIEGYYMVGFLAQPFLSKNKVNAIYGGEMSAHHYFRDFSYCDSGMIPWLLVLELLSQADGKTLSDLMKERQERFPISGEINSKVADADKVFAELEAKYGKEGKVTKVDGLSVEFDKWRFNVRKSNTEPVVRLNVETRQDKALCEEKTKELLAIIRG